MFWTIILCVTIIIGLLKYWVKINRDEAYEKIPGPPGIFLFGNAFDFIKTPAQTFNLILGIAHKFRDMFKGTLGPKKFVAIYSPEDIEILISGTKNNSKGFLYIFIKAWLKEGLLVSDGSKWHQRRKILTPAFHFNILKHFHTLLHDNSKKLVEDLQKEVGNPKTELSSYIVPFTLNSICETAMGIKLDESDQGTAYKEAIINFGNLVIHRLQRVWLYSKFIYNMTAVGKLHNKLLNYMTTFRNEVIYKRSNSEEHKKILEEINLSDEKDEIGLKGKKLAMLDLLLQVKKSGKIDSEGIGEEVDTFMFEGHDTTASALQFTFMLLANNPEYQEKIVEECRSILSNRSWQEVTMNDLSQMKYLECCIKESLRLYPPVFVISRIVSERTKFTNYEVPAGTDCNVLIYVLHRDPKIFKDPLSFKPERFTDTQDLHPFAYIPFSAGPRNCIGQKFAMMELKLVISAVLLRYKLVAVTRPQDIVLTPNIVLRSENPIYVQIVNRDV